MKTIDASRRISSRFSVVGPALSLVLVASLVACGSNTAATDDNAAPEGDQALVAKVPEDIKARGELRGVTDANYPPFTSLENEKPAGLDIDIANAVAAELGLKIAWTNQTFSGIIPALQAGKYDFASSAMSVQPERAKVVTLVTYFNQPQQFFGRADLEPQPQTPADLCGLRVASVTGTTAEKDTATWSDDCVKAGNEPLKIVRFASGAAVTLALSSGRVDVSTNGFLISRQIAKASNGKLEAMGETRGESILGVAFPKNSELAAVFAEGLQQIMDNGEYESILAKYDATVGALDTAKVVNE